jgi:GTP-binding protein Era
MARHSSTLPETHDDIVAAGKIGQAARAQAEPLLGKRLYLDLWVKVRDRWRRDESILARFGYPMPKKPRKRHRK